MIKIMFLLTSMFLSGCSTVSASKGEWRFSRTSFGTDLHVKSLELRETKSGIVVILQGVQSEQVEAMKAVAEGAAKGAVEGAKP